MISIVQKPSNKLIYNTLPNYLFRRKVHLLSYWLFERQTINLNEPSLSRFILPYCVQLQNTKSFRDYLSNKVSIYNTLPNYSS